jgi:hypothetical protein
MKGNTLLAKIIEIKSGNDDFQQIVDLFSKLNNSEMIFEDSKLKFNQNGRIVEFSLKLNSSENDGFTETYETVVLGQNIRVVKPIGIAFINSVQQNDCEDLFTVGSNLNSDGFAISFILTSLTDKKILEIKYQDILDEAIKVIINAIVQYHRLLGKSELNELASRLNNALRKKSKEVYNYPNGNIVLQILQLSGITLTKTFSSDAKNMFENFKQKILELPLNVGYRCNIYKEENVKLINNEKGHISINSNEIILKSYDGNGDYIVFYPVDGILFCKYVVMNGRVIVNQAFNRVEFVSNGAVNASLTFIAIK